MSLLGRTWRAIRNESSLEDLRVSAIMKAPAYQYLFGNADEFEKIQGDYLKHPVTKKRALEYPPFSRAIYLLADAVSKNILLGYFRPKNKNLSERARRFQRCMEIGFDGGVTSPHEWVKNLVVDMLFGNAFVTFERSGEAYHFVRYNSETVPVERSDEGFRYIINGDLAMPQNTLRVSMANPTSYETGVSSTVAIRPGSKIKKIHEVFAPRTLDILKQALAAGCASQDYINKRLSRKGNVSDGHFLRLMEGVSGSETLKQIYENIGIYNKAGAPIPMTEQGSVETYDVFAGLPTALEAAEVGKREIASFFGLPAAILGSESNERGSGLAELSSWTLKLAISPIIDAFVSAISQRFTVPGEAFMVRGIFFNISAKDVPEYLTALQADPGQNTDNLILPREARDLVGLPTDAETLEELEEYNGKLREMAQGGEDDDDGIIEMPQAATIKGV